MRLFSTADQAAFIVLDSSDEEEIGKSCSALNPIPHRAEGSSVTSLATSSKVDSAAASGAVKVVRSNKRLAPASRVHLVSIAQKRCH